MDVVKVCPRLLHGGNGVYEGYITVKVIVTRKDLDRFIRGSAVFKWGNGGGGGLNDLHPDL